MTPICAMTRMITVSTAFRKYKMKDRQDERPEENTFFHSYLVPGTWYIPVHC